MQVRQVLRNVGVVGLLAATGWVALPAYANTVASAQVGAQQNESPWSRLILTSPLLPSPLVASAASAQDTQDLQAALDAWQAAGNAAANVTDRHFLEEYLVSHPHSAWRAAVLGNLGYMAQNEGRFSQALVDWNAAWQAGRDIRHPGVRVFVDKVLGDLLTLQTRLGHRDEVEKLLSASAARVLQGSATEARTAAREGLWEMKTMPEAVFLCGPLALRQLQLLNNPSATPVTTEVGTLKGMAHGYDLASLAKLAGQDGLAMEAIHREKGAPVPVPSVVHWKTGHYAAILAEKDGRYQVRDAALAKEYWVSREVLDEESSGYFLSEKKVGLSDGWRVAKADEARKIVGAGTTGQDKPSATPACSSDCSCDANSSGSSSSAGGSASNTSPAHMLSSAVQSMVVSLALQDTPIDYVPTKGPGVPLTINYSQREAYQPSTFTYFNLGQKWTYSGLTYIIDNPTSAGSSVERYKAGGGTVDYSGYTSSTGAFTADEADMSVLVLTSSSPITYERRLSDGTVETYSQSDGQTSYPRRVFLSKVTDPAGNTLTYTYDSQLRLTTLTDATGRKTTLQYTHTDPLLITGFTDPFGRTATITYDSQGRLTSITDVVGLTSTVAYDGTSTFVNSLTTPYGTSTFAYGESSATTRWLEITDPKGATSRVEGGHGASGVPYSETLVPSGISAFNAYINARNTFYWDATAYARAKGDYTQAQIKHWYHNRDNTNETTDVLESIKLPLENRVWYNYPGQSWSGANGTCDKPSAVARVLPDGSTQISKYTYNDQGNLLTHTDPKGRVTTNTYASNGIDLLTVKQTTANGTDTQAELTWNSAHRPLTVKDAAGQTTTFTYSSAGQLLTQTNAKGETTSYAYNTLGNLISITNPLGKVQARYTYDSFGRVVAVTDNEGYVLRYTYDAANRITKITYPDGTTRETTWDKFDVASIKDRNGKVTTYAYDANRNLTSETDAAKHTVQYGYQANNMLISLTDANGNVTQWTRDIEGNITAKVFPDGTQATYAYDNAGRLTDTTDALGQIEHRAYNADNTVSSIAYQNAKNATAGVSYTYDSYYPRLASYTDGLGTTSLSYVAAGTLGAGKVAAADGPYNNDTLSFTYDVLGRIATQTTGNATAGSQSFTYDKLGRVVSETNPLGSFSYQYLGQTGQLTQQLLANGFHIDFKYEGNTGDRRLHAIVPQSRQNQNVGQASLYRTAPENLILAQAQWPGMLTRYNYDDAYRLTAATRGMIAGQVDGDQDDHRHEDHHERSWSLGDKDRLQHPDWISSGWEHGWREPDGHDSRSDRGDRAGKGGRDDHDQSSHWPSGPEDLGNYHYTYDAAGNLTAVKTPEGDWTGTVNTNNQYTTAQGNTWSYDAAGNVTDDGQRTYTWDAAHRLISVTDKTTGHLSQFTYDGFSRLTVRKEYTSADASPTEIHYLWCGDFICQTRDASDTITARYYSQGELQGSSALYYNTNHLGSVLGLLDAQGKSLGQTSYGPYGEPEQTQGKTSDYRYAGMYYHASTGLYLTHYRFYDPQSGRWLNRDPIGEKGGVNLYAYVEGDPAARRDADGRFSIIAGGGGSAIVGGGVEGSAGIYFDPGLFGDCRAAGGYLSGGVGGGVNVGLNGYLGLVFGPASNVNSPFVNLNISTVFGSVTVMFDPASSSIGGVAIGPAAELGVSVTYTDTAKAGHQQKVTCNCKL